MKYTKTAHENTRKYLDEWQNSCKQNFFAFDNGFRHSINYYFGDYAVKISQELEDFADKLLTIEDLVKENHLRYNYPRLEKYDGVGNDVEKIMHHPNYETVGNVIYASRMLERLSKFGGLQEGLAFFFLSGQLGEAGHNCPFACSAGIIRVLQKVNNIADSDYYIKKLCHPSFTDNYTGAQFLTEVQGGSDVGQNATEAKIDSEGNWRISGEKWFCSNANADLILMTARFDANTYGTKGLGLFLVPKYLPNNEHNYFSILRLKEKIGTNAMASGEVVFLDAVAYPVGRPEDGFKLVMENVLHISRLCNSICTLAMARRAFYIAKFYAKYRIAFGNQILNYPLVQENLAIIKAENDAGLAMTMATIALQDKYDKKQVANLEETAILLRLLANLCKYYTALYSVEHIHHSIDILAGNGAIETFSILPRLFRDSVVCENWEGTHNTLRMQIARDILKFEIDNIFINYINSQLVNLKINDSLCSKLLSQLNNYLDKFSSNLKQYKNSDTMLQSLQIKYIVDSMSIILALTELFKEALHQIGFDKVNYKLNSLNLFIYKHLETGREVTHEYLDLIKSIAN